MSQEHNNQEGEPGTLHEELRQRRTAMGEHLFNRISAGKLALVAMKGGAPAGRMFQTFSATQLLGGKNWSLSVIRFKPAEDWKANSDD